MSSEDARTKLMALRQELLDLSDAARDDRKPVELDQQSVGRLSRLDSMQVQEMAKAANARRTVEVRRIEAALARVDEDDYGWCVECGEVIEPARLALDPAVPRCAGCA
ncbi:MULTISPECIES: TraR/DksA family transcriptional regulator [Maricaulis]|jgi:DnaK suppressor protein|uniref:Transcriptional regulator, TraR/DksA family n=1 Tax=Maricaulis maris (strain MCS10) TaxID=394221 RepID=Q0ALK2_MARMM|nr:MULTISPECIES: TraR/DksA C4-type zinc finger protein [Maricaulis]ABI66841.1 transcriptional regulator, TraR/DksA family [Maricaulis maris MCS10]MAC90521.1 molecular chaperone DnaK [Maricaulis sp.]